VSVRCPTDTRRPDGTPHTIAGCGSLNVIGPDVEGLYDCLNCGMWFTEKEVAVDG
jgi:hypothetical protein